MKHINKHLNKAQGLMGLIARPSSNTNYRFNLGGSPGLVVMGRDSCSEGRGFESQHHILDRHFSHIFAVKIVLFV